MFKLNSTNGKFDIIFTGGPTFDDKARENGLRATSASRRKNDEWKSKVFEKKVLSNSKFKETKTSRLRVEKEVKGKTSVKKKENTKLSNTKEDAIRPSTIEYNDPVKDLKVSPTLLADAEAEDDFMGDVKVEYKKNDSNNKLKLVRKETYVHKSNNEDKTTDKNVTPTNVPETITAPLISQRQLDVKRRQATPVEEYYPWGRPGAGAPLKKENPGDIRVELRKSKASWRDGYQSDSPRENKETASRGSELDNASLESNSSVYIRGQADGAEKKRLKELEHQKAIAEQVNAKLLQKRLEKERQFKEDKEAEERFKRDQEILRLRYEEEKRQREEKEEARMRQQKHLQESIRKATEEAIKLQKESRTVQKNSMATRSSEDSSIPFQHKQHAEDEVITPQQSDDIFEQIQDNLEVRVESVSLTNDLEQSGPETNQKKHKMQNQQKKKSTKNSNVNIKKNKSNLMNHADSIERKGDIHYQGNVRDLSEDPGKYQKQKNKKQTAMESRSVNTQSFLISDKKSEVQQLDHVSGTKGSKKNGKAKIKHNNSKIDRFDANDDVTLKTQHLDSRNGDGQKSEIRLGVAFKKRNNESSLIKNMNNRERVDVKWKQQENNPEEINSDTDSQSDVNPCSSRVESDRTEVKQNVEYNRNSKEVVECKQPEQKGAQKVNGSKALQTLVDHYLVPFHRTKTECLIQDEINHDEFLPDVEQVRRTRQPSNNSVVTQYLSAPESPSRRQQAILDQLKVLRQGLQHKHEEHMAFSDLHH